MCQFPLLPSFSRSLVALVSLLVVVDVLITSVCHLKE